MSAIEFRQQPTNSVIVICSALVCIGRNHYQSLCCLSDNNIVCVELMEVTKASIGEGLSRLRLEKRYLDSPRVRYLEKDFNQYSRRTELRQEDRLPHPHGRPARLTFARCSPSTAGLSSYRPT